MKKSRVEAAPGLGERKWSILRCVVTDYVETAEPVGSEALVVRYRLDIGPATVRSEMAEMAEWGYLRQPHTSAGRVPSDTGYRYFVNRIEAPRPPGRQARAQLARLRGAGDDVIELLQESCRILSRLSEYIAIASTVRNETLRLRQVILSPVGSSRLLMVLVLSNGQVENRLIEAPSETTLADLHRATEMLNTFVAGRSLREIARTPVEERPPARLYAAGVRELKSTARSLSKGKTLHEGVGNLLSQPEFQQDLDSLRAILAHLEDDTLLERALESVGPDGGIVMIGSESGEGTMSNCSIVANQFYIGGVEAGVIGLLGPTRMRYEKAIALVRFTGKVLTDTLTRMFAG